MLNLQEQFQVAAGSVTGTEHLRIGKNNQDAYSVHISENQIIAVVCDGCGSGLHSEVGAKLGVRLVVESIHRTLKQTNGEWNFEYSENSFWQRIQQEILYQLKDVAHMLGGSTAKTVQDYLLFTIVGAILTPATTVIFALGDGAIALNNEVLTISPFAQNAPPYLAYQLIPSELKGFDLTQLQLRIYHCLPTEHVQSLLIGTDGVNDLINLAEKNLPGKTETVGAIAQFWQDDRYFRNPDQIRRRISLINRELYKLDRPSQQLLKINGLLPDDTTLISIRKNPLLQTAEVSHENARENG